MTGDDSLAKFRDEYSKLHRALTKSHDQEKRLIKKCRELNTEIVNNAAKVQSALYMAQKDDTTIASLRKEIEKAWKLVDQAHDKEIKAKDTINQLKDEISNLSKLVEKGAGLSAGQENMVKELLRVRDELQRQTEEQSTAMKVIETQLREVHKQNTELKAKQEVDGVTLETQVSKQTRSKHAANTQRTRSVHAANTQHTHVNDKIQTLFSLTHSFPLSLPHSLRMRQLQLGMPRLAASRGAASAWTRSSGTSAPSSTRRRKSRRRCPRRWSPRRRRLGSLRSS